MSAFDPQRTFADSRLLQRKLIIEPPLRRPQIPAVIGSLEAIVGIATHGAGNATTRFHQRNCGLSDGLAAHGARYMPNPFAFATGNRANSQVGPF